MKRVISIISLIAMMFNFAAIPAAAESETVNFTSPDNIAYGKTIIPISGSYSSGNPGPSANRQMATDGKIATYHYGNKGPYAFTIDLGGAYLVDEFTSYFGEYRATRQYTLYSGQQVDPDKVLLENSGNGEIRNINGTNVAVKTNDLTAASETLRTTRYITLECTATGSLEYHEFYIKGTPAKEEITIDFEGADNLAHNKVIKNLGKDDDFVNNSSSEVNDGNIETHLESRGKCSFLIDLGKCYEITEFSAYLSAGNEEKEFNVYRGTSVKSEWLVGTVKADKSTIFVKGTDDAESTEVIRASTTTKFKTQYITIEYKDDDPLICSELYVKGTEIADAEYNKDFKSGNIAYGKKLTHIAGIEGGGDSPPGGSIQKATDGDIMSYHRLTGIDDWSNKNQTGVIFSIDLEEEYELDTITIYTFTEGGIRSNAGDEIRFYNGSRIEKDNVNYIGTAAPLANLKVINNEQHGVVEFVFPAETRAREIVVESTSRGSFFYSEIVITKKNRPIDELRFADFTNQAVGSVSKDFDLPDKVSYQGEDYPIVWTTSHPDIVRLDGNQTDIVPQEVSVPVKLTAATTYNAEICTKSFDMVIVPEVHRYIAGGITNEYSDRITKNLNLIAATPDAMTVTWESDKPDVIATDGKVTRQAYDEKVVLTANIEVKPGVIEEEKFIYIVRAANKDENNFILVENDFATGAPHYDLKKSGASSVMTVGGKLAFSRIGAGELSATKYFISDLKESPFVVKNGGLIDRLIIEHYIRIVGTDSGTATIYNEDSQEIISYGIKNIGDATKFFINGEENSTSIGYETDVFVRIEFDTSAKKIRVLVNGEEVESGISVRDGVSAGISSIKFEQGVQDGNFYIDSLAFMAEGTQHDKIALDLEKLNFKEEYVLSQRYGVITNDLTLLQVSKLGSVIRYESDKPEVLAPSGKVTRPEVETDVAFRVYFKYGNTEMEEPISSGIFKVKAAKQGNLALDAYVDAKPKIAEGSNTYNAVDGLADTMLKIEGNTEHSSERILELTLSDKTKFNKIIINVAEDSDDISSYEISYAQVKNVWTSIPTDVVLQKGENIVLLDSAEAKYIKFVAKDMAGKTMSIAEFELYYLNDISVSDAFALDLQEVAVKPEGQIVTTDLTLKTSCTNGSTVVWTSSHPQIISDELSTLGKLTWPKKDTLVTLTATITSKDGSITEKKSFQRTVKGSAAPTPESGVGRPSSTGPIKNAGTSNPAPIPENENGPDTPSKGTFADVSAERWSYEYIRELKEAGIVSGDGEYFYPENAVKREEFVKMLVLSLGMTPGGNADFDDVSEDEWYHEYIAAAVEAGIVQGFERKFGIGNNITRQDMSVMTIRALNKLNIELKEGEAFTFKDSEEIAPYAKESVDILTAAGILNGDGENFAPQSSLTREQAAKVLCIIRKEIIK